MKNCVSSLLLNKTSTRAIMMVMILGTIAVVTGSCGRKDAKVLSKDTSSAMTTDSTVMSEGDKGTELETK